MLKIFFLLESLSKLQLSLLVTYFLSPLPSLLSFWVIYDMGNGKVTLGPRVVILKSNPLKMVSVQISLVSDRLFHCFIIKLHAKI